jgi:hypothetical protein
MNTSYLVPCFCFVMITIYAFFFTKEPLMRRILLRNNARTIRE